MPEPTTLLERIDLWMEEETDLAATAQLLWDCYAFIAEADRPASPSAEPSGATDCYFERAAERLTPPDGVVEVQPGVYLSERSTSVFASPGEPHVGETPRDREQALIRERDEARLHDAVHYQTLCEQVPELTEELAHWQHTSDVNARLTLDAQLELSAERARLREQIGELSSKWEDSADYEYNNANREYASALNQCAQDLLAVLDLLDATPEGR